MPFIHKYIVSALACALMHPAQQAHKTARDVASLAAYDETLARRVTQEATHFTTQPPARSNQPFELHRGNAAVAFTPVGAAPSQLELVGRQAVYRNAYPSTDFILVASSTWVETLWLLRGPDAPRHFAFDVTFKKGVQKIERRSDGSLDFMTAAGVVAFHMPQPFAVDASGQRIEATVAWKKGQVLVALPTEAAMQFPVLLDPAMEVERWVNRTPVPEKLPPGRESHAAATLGDVLLVFGGTQAPRKYMQDLWAWDGTAWKQLTPASKPPIRHAHAMVAFQDKVLLFGGWDGQSRLNDTWEWDGTAWKQLTPASKPPIRHAHAMVTFQDKVLLFGGIGMPGSAVQSLNDMWEWNGTTWTQRQVARVPPARHEHAMAVLNSTVFLYGGEALSQGSAAATLLDDSWTWDGTAWTQMKPATSVNTPAARKGHTLTAFKKEIVMAGGMGDMQARLQDTWLWNGTSWLKKPTSDIPKTLSGHTATSFQGKVFLFGGLGTGYHNDLYVWDGAMWTQRQQSGRSPRRMQHALARLGKKEKVLLFGGSDGMRASSETWMWDGMLWTRLDSVGNPKAALTHAMASFGEDKVLLFGGTDIMAAKTSTFFSETWVFSAGSGWKLQNTPTTPPGRTFHAMVAFRDKVLLFGGAETKSKMTLNDTWEWNGTTWTQLQPAASPSHRASHAMAAFRDTVLLFGGLGKNATLNDTWEWNGTTWTQLQPAASPSPRTSHAMAAFRDTVLLFGGIANDEAFNDTWEWNGDSWKQVQAALPTPRIYFAMVGFPENKVTLHGGLDAMSKTGEAYVETWQFQYQTTEGNACRDNTDCQSGFCEDEVCCATACGGSNKFDCKACSTQAGAPRNGGCSTASMTTICRPAAGTCDVAEYCTGSAMICPEDKKKPENTPCPTGACSGTSAECIEGKQGCGCMTPGAASFLLLLPFLLRRTRPHA